MMKNWKKSGNRQGFTLIELMIVVVIVAVLSTFTLAGIRSLLTRAAMTRELNAARNVVNAYRDLALDNHGRLLDVSAAEPIKGEDGSYIPSYIAQRYPARLGPYLDWDFSGSVLVGENEKYAGDFYSTTVFPNFGLNSVYCGGDPTKGRYNPQKSLVTCDNPGGLLVFASARHDSGTNTEGSDRLGFYRILPPETGWRDKFKEDESARFWGYVDMRFNGKTVAAFLDGHVEALDENQIRDHKIWTGRRDVRGLK